MTESWEHIHRAADRQRPALKRAVMAALNGYRDGLDGPALANRVAQGAGFRELWALFDYGRERAGKALAAEATRLVGTVVRDAYRGEERSLAKRFVEGLDLVNEEAIAFIESYGFELVTAIDNVTREALRELVLRGAKGELTVQRMAMLIRESVGLTPNQTVAMENVERDAFERALKEGKSIAQAHDLAAKAAERYRKAAIRSRAENIARTETLRAANAGQQAMWNQAVRDGLLPATALKMWIITPDDRLCDRCRPLRDLEAPVSEPFQTPEGAIDHPPLHPRCLPGDSRVLALGVSATSQRWYDGDLVVLRTASGKQLACTPNHPVLTPGGWVAAGLLNEGGHVISSGLGEWVPGNNGNDDDMPPRIQDVAEAFGRAEHVAARPVPVSPEDFHGDGVGSEVAVIGADSLLWDAFDSASGQHRPQSMFSRGRVKGSLLNGLRVLQPGFMRRRGASCCRMCGGDLGVAAVRRHSSPFHSFSSAPPSNLDAVFQQSPPYGVAVHTETGSERVFRFPALVRGDDNRIGQSVIRAVAGAVPEGGEIAPDSLWVADVELAHQICDGLAGPVFSDQIVRVQMKAFSGHVFNLETAGGYYIADGIITHNCRCAMGISKL